MRVGTGGLKLRLLICFDVHSVKIVYVVLVCAVNGSVHGVLRVIGWSYGWLVDSNIRCVIVVRRRYNGAREYGSGPV